MGKKRIYSLDALKFFASIIIVFHHYQIVTGVKFLKYNFSGGKIYFGYIVELFFILSGFFTALNIQKNQESSFSKFMWSKIIRLYPMAMISTFVFCIACWIYKIISGEWYQGNPIGLWKTFASLMLIHSGGG